MNGYISKERAEICVMSAIEGSEDEGVLRALDDVRLAINSEPDANVAPVVHGRWEVVYNSVGKQEGQCTHCGKNSGILITKKSYCPNCGAKMDESEGTGNE